MGNPLIDDIIPSLVGCTVPMFDRYILRKRPEPGSKLSCIGWHLHQSKGPALHYGAHDFDARADPYTVTSELQYEASLSEATPFTAGECRVLDLHDGMARPVDMKGGEGSNSLPVCWAKG